MLCLLLCIILACSLWHTVSSEDIKIDCFLDFDEEMECSWEVDASTDCTVLYLEVRAVPFVKAIKTFNCIPKKKRGEDETHKCFCTYDKEIQNYLEFYVTLKSNGKVISKHRFSAINNYKARPPVNVTFIKGESGYFLTWGDDYAERHLLHNNPETDYEVSCQRFVDKGVVEESTDKDLIRRRITPEMQIRVSIYCLYPSRKYVGKVRQKTFFSTQRWSEWSEPATWVGPGRRREKRRY